MKKIDRSFLPTYGRKSHEKMDPQIFHWRHMYMSLGLQAHIKFECMVILIHLKHLAEADTFHILW